MFFALLASAVGFVLFVLPVLSFVRAYQLAREVDRLRARVDGLERAARRSSPADGAATGTAAASAAAGTSGPAAAGPPTSTPAPAPVPPATAHPAGDIASPHEPLVPVPSLAVAPAALPETPSVTPAAVPSTPPLPPYGPVAPPAAAAARRDTDVPDATSLEERIAGRGLLYAGVLVLIFGVSFFLKFAFDNGWLNETGRVVVGLVAGVAAVTAGTRLGGRGLTGFGHAVAGLGVAVLYLTIYAALSFYALIAPSTAFTAMIGVTGVAAWLAHRAAAQSLAFIAVAGGFLTPFLVEGGAFRQDTLFTYVALLVAGTVSLARHHRWLGLHAATYWLTVVTLSAWADRFYTDAVWLRTWAYLTLFCLLFVLVLREVRRMPGAVARLVAAFLWTAPFLYHLVAVTIAWDHSPALYVYLIVFAAAGIGFTAGRNASWARVVVLGAAYLPLIGSLAFAERAGIRIPVVVTGGAITFIHLAALFGGGRTGTHGEDEDPPLTVPELLVLHTAVLALYGVLYDALDPEYGDYRAAPAVVLTLVAAGLWRVWRGRDDRAALHAAGLAGTLVALGIGAQFDGRAAVIGWAAEALAAGWAGLRTRSRPFALGALGLLALATGMLLEGYDVTPAGFTAILNARSLATLTVLAAAYLLAWRWHADEGPEADAVRTALHVAASGLTLLWLSAEVRSYWDVRADTPQAYLYEELELSLGWGLYAALLVAAGKWRQYPPVRWVGILTLAVTVVKVFVVDLSTLGGVYRVIGFLVLGALLLGVSYMYQRSRTDIGADPAPPVG